MTTQPETALDRARAGLGYKQGFFSRNLARVLTAEGTDEKLARKLDWEAFEPPAGKMIAPGVMQYSTDTSLERRRAAAIAKARSLLTLLAEMAEVGE